MQGAASFSEDAPCLFAGVGLPPARDSVSACVVQLARQLRLLVFQLLLDKQETRDSTAGDDSARDREFDAFRAAFIAKELPDPGSHGFRCSPVGAHSKVERDPDQRDRAQHSQVG